ncbi:GAF domain-containing protein [uncultured Arthrobacter sp.]|uniref:GAF domain-containing protein n=1 Tax=uncultured Arthrobacter sp. TaxID=114050 RepID=UPI0028D12CB4|nr:GAF domain-containing protein [uncultured Arthrobacter sp.]
MPKSDAAAQARDLRFTSPLEYARALRQAHEATISGRPDPYIAPSLVSSWQRSLSLGIDPDRHRPVHRHDVSEARRLGADHRLAAVMPELSQLIADETTDGRHLLIVTDHLGEVLWRIGSRRALRQADALEFVEGADWSESGVGTNAISEALVTGTPAQLFSAEHLVRTHHDWACTAAPIRDPFRGDVLGVLDVSGPIESVTPDSLRMVRCGVRLAEELLKSTGAPTTGAVPGRRGLDPAAQTSRTPQTLTLRILGDRPTAEVDGGAPRALTLRRAEILALLASRSGGWSAEELAYELYGEDGAAASVRTEMHRIRGLLGNVVEPNPYRFTAEVKVETDASTVAAHLRAGRVADALSLYPAKLLTRSANFAIELMRDELNEAVGASVRASGEADLVLQWCSTDMGAADSAAAAVVEQVFGAADPRFQLLRAKMARLDRELRA